MKGQAGLFDVIPERPAPTPEPAAEPTRVETVAEARERIAAELAEHREAECPCCGHVQREYRRTITSTQVQFLIDLCRLAAASAKRKGVRVVDAAVDVFEISGQRGGDYAKLAYWGLIRAAEIDGFWHITGRGIAWLRGEISVPRYAYVLKGAVTRYDDGDGAPKSVHDAYGERFDFDSIMAAVRDDA